MAGAEAEAWWKARFRDRVVDAHCRLSMIVWKIGNARGSLAGPVRAPATDAMLTRILRAEKALEDASSDLSAAAYLLGSATELALRGGADAPWCPLPRVDRLRDTAAARKLREARVLATEACHGVEKCCVSLLGLRLLLDHPLLPGIDEFLDAERLNAFDLLEYVMQAADGCVSLGKRPQGLARRLAQLIDQGPSASASCSSAALRPPWTLCVVKHALCFPCVLAR